MIGEMLETSIKKKRASDFGEGADRFHRYIRATSIGDRPASIQFDSGGDGIVDQPPRFQAWSRIPISPGIDPLFCGFGEGIAA